MNSIHRLSVTVEDYQELTLTGAPISVAADRDGRSDRFDMWFEHRDDFEAQAGIWIFGTGHPVPWDASTRPWFAFLGTVVTPSGLVWHVYNGPLKGEPMSRLVIL